MKLLLTCVLAGATALAQAPAKTPGKTANSTSAQKPDHHGRKTGALTPVQPDDGWIDGRLYTSDYFRFTYVLPENFDVDEEFMASTEESETTFVLLAAEDPYNAEDQRSVVVLLADKPAPNVTTALDYVGKTATEAANHQGFETLTPAREVTIAGRPFARADFRKGGTFQTAVFTWLRGFAVGFTLASPSETGLQKMLDSLATLRFDTPPAGKP